MLISYIFCVDIRQFLHFLCLFANFYSILVYVAICDNLLLLCALWIFTLAKHFYVTVGFVPYLFAIGQTASTNSVWLDCLITLERFLVVSQPQKHRKIFGNLKKTGLILLILTLIAIFFELPRFWELQIGWEFYCGEWYWLSGPNPIRQTELYSNGKLLVGYFAFNFIGPFLLQTVLNVRIVLAIRKANKFHKISGGYQLFPAPNAKEESSTTTMRL